VAVSSPSCEPEIRSPDHFLFVDFPPNSGSANVGRVFAHTGSIVWHHVMPVSVEVVVMKLHLIRRRKLWSSVVRAVSALNSHVGLEAHLRRQPTKKRKRPWCRSFFALVEVVVALVLVLHNNQRAGSGLQHLEGFQVLDDRVAVVVTQRVERFL
jgi:hypothetical protein